MLWGEVLEEGKVFGAEARVGILVDLRLDIFLVIRSLVDCHLFKWGDTNVVDQIHRTIWLVPAFCILKRPLPPKAAGIPAAEHEVGLS
ncbi:hypothetical protein KC351_g127 [Hortaea werneckii]|nr:hypothetical protein KC351_g127 [Hortaea werneckii]